VAGVLNGKPVIRFRLNWYCTLDIDKDWDLRGNGWHVLVQGEAPISTYITFPVEKARMSTAMGSLTAYRVLNAVPYVCAATAGIKTSVDLPFMVPQIRIA
jgi:4-hydroxy-tetrahydrodipicolinate reductase